eukprot:CAMPEP_0171384346 /NCGR_PEP_ID=MMETSP0879-20121228/38422_1 /TAXON_ID=67004 /ORGANISM="Thalassiosira weissflogii, Strain CCMP1336" /LENGTH=195 /DNA_ID=CAMNT_0011896617 /DNA_START=339 /DNA_END=927 /DNA_ORIENTATION=+
MILVCWLLNPLAKFIKVNPFSGLLIDEFSPFHILRNQTHVQLRIIGNPPLLTDNIGDGLSLGLENFLNLGTGFKVEMLTLDYEGRLFKLMERWGGGKSPFEGIGDEGNDDVFTFRESGEASDGSGFNGVLGDLVGNTPGHWPSNGSKGNMVGIVVVFTLGNDDVFTFREGGEASDGCGFNGVLGDCEWKMKVKVV